MNNMQLFFHTLRGQHKKKWQQIRKGSASPPINLLLEFIPKLFHSCVKQLHIRLDLFRRNLTSRMNKIRFIFALFLAKIPNKRIDRTESDKHYSVISVSEQPMLYASVFFSYVEKAFTTRDTISAVVVSHKNLSEVRIQSEWLSY